jgi:hypothetical protein
MAFKFQDRFSVSWRWWMLRVTKHQQNGRKCWRISTTYLLGSLPNNPGAGQHK